MKAESKENIKVFISTKDSFCEECKEHLGRRAWITLLPNKGAICLSCADLEHFAFLPSGNTVLTRRSRKNSKLSAVVLKWSRARKRYERQGLLVEEQAIVAAERECFADEEARARQRARQKERRVILDRQYLKRFAEEIRKIYPRCSVKAEIRIAEHACLKHSGRVGRSAQAKKLNQKMIRLAVAAHIRHEYTSYDTLLIKGFERWEARDKVEEETRQILFQWAKK